MCYVHAQQESLVIALSWHCACGQKGPETLACHLTMYIERGRLVGELAQW